ncbi:mannose-6-phosphate receptor binding domain-containing protein [Mycena floridula]|nr:mannose-6-phosphate receptor binding domain-containing protein [Mycena floridula]
MLLDLLLLALPLALTRNTARANPVASQDKPCTLVEAGKIYDLQPLSSASKDYGLRTSGDRILGLNVCKSVNWKVDVVQEPWALKDVDQSKVGAFIRREHGDFSIGETNTNLTLKDGHVQMFLTGGSKCPSNERASTVIDFVCDPSVSDNGKPRLVAQLPIEEKDSCAFFIEWRTHVACSKNVGGGFGGFLASVITFILILMILYIVLGTLYNRFILNLRGFDQIPQFSFESMKYHSMDAWTWCKETYEKWSSGQNVRLGQQAPDRVPNRRGGGVNSYSHQATVNAEPIAAETFAEPPEDVEEGGFVRPTAGGFVRPTQGDFVRPTPKNLKINPISHQSQFQRLSTTSGSAASTLASTTLNNSTSTFNSSASKLQPTPPKKVEAEATREEREFMLGDDDDDDEEGQEMGAIVTSTNNSTAEATPPNVESVPPNPASTSSSAPAAPATKQ